MKVLFKMNWKYNDMKVENIFQRKSIQFDLNYKKYVVFKFKETERDGQSTWETKKQKEKRERW